MDSNYGHVDIWRSTGILQTMLLGPEDRWIRRVLA